MHNNTELVEILCPLCGENKTQSISKKGQHGIPVFVSICLNDGLVYLNPRWTKERYQQYYLKKYDAQYRSDIRAIEKDDEKYKTIKIIWGRLLASGFTSFKSVLDIGCGMGWSLDFISKQNIGPVALAAIEPSKHCITNIIHNVKAELLSTDADSNWHQNNKGRFDLVIMRHVLEHFANPIEVLKKVKHVLSSKGVVYIAVPDMMSPKGSLENYWFRIVHTYYFSKETLVYSAALGQLNPIISCSENSELWGIFTQVKKAVDISYPAVYSKQIEIIQNYRKRYRYKELVLFLPRKISRLLPAWGRSISMKFFKQSNCE